LQRPIEDIAVIVCDNPALQFSMQLILALAEANVALIFCNDKHLPAATLHSFFSHSLHSRRIKEQTATKEKLKERLWQEIIKEIIRNQSKLLTFLHGQDGGLMGYSKEVEKGDRTNKEAVAGKIYWHLLFNETDFRRDRTQANINIQLNYGYSIVRSAMARALTAVGLHPALGIHHHNQYNSFCLADDLMELFRPLIDEISYRILQSSGEISLLRQEDKAELLSVLNREMIVAKKSYPMLEAMHLYAHSLWESYETKKVALEFPRWQF
jgi:CRISPR-associated protein Cas1